MATLTRATELIDWYRARWEIEMFFLILKEGCKVEQLQLEDIERLEVALALYMVIAWRINRLMRLGRTLPDMPADVVFEQDEWHAAFILNKKPIPRQIPTLNTVVRLIAQRGGFLGRKGDGEPGALARPGAWPVQLWRNGSAGTDLKPNSGESVSLRLRARYAGDGYEA